MTIIPSLVLGLGGVVGVFSLVFVPIIAAAKGRSALSWLLFAVGWFLFVGWGALTAPVVGAIATAVAQDDPTRAGILVFEAIFAAGAFVPVVAVGLAPRVRQPRRRAR